MSITVLHHPQPEDKFEIKTVTRDRTREPYPVFNFGEDVTMFPSFEQLYMLREVLDNYLHDLSLDPQVEKEHADAIR